MLLSEDPIAVQDAVRADILERIAPKATAEDGSVGCKTALNLL